MVLSPDGNASATGLTVNAKLLLTEVEAFDATVTAAVQFAVIADSAGGVYVALSPLPESVPQPVEGFSAQLTPELLESSATVAVKVTALAPALIVSLPLCARLTAGVVCVGVLLVPEDLLELPHPVNATIDRAGKRIPAAYHEFFISCLFSLSQFCKDKYGINSAPDQSIQDELFPLLK